MTGLERLIQKITNAVVVGSAVVGSLDLEECRCEALEDDRRVYERLKMKHEKTRWTDA